MLQRILHTWEQRRIIFLHTNTKSVPAQKSNVRTCGAVLCVEMDKKRVTQSNVTLTKLSGVPLQKTTLCMLANRTRILQCHFVFIQRVPDKYSSFHIAYTFFTCFGRVLSPHCLPFVFECSDRRIREYEKLRRHAHYSGNRCLLRRLK